MANKKKHIDDLFKDNLQGSQLPLDGSEWGRLADALQPKKKKRFAWWWFAIGILLVSATGLIYYAFNSSSNASRPLVENTEVGNEKQEGNTNAVKNTEDIESVESVENEKLNSGEESNDQNASIESKEQVNNTSNTPSNTGQSKTQTTNSGKNKNGNTTDSKPNPSAAKSGNNSKIGSGAEKANEKFELLKISAISTVVFRTNDPYGAPLLSIEDKLDQKPPFYIYPMASLIDTFDPIQKFINPYVGFSMGGSRLNQQLNSSIDNYTQYRNGNESASFRPNLGLDLGSGYKGFQIASGLRYQEKGQENSPMFKYEIYDSVLRVDVNGDTSYPRYNYRDTLVQGVASPRYRYVTIPLSIGKTIYDGEKFEFTIGINSNVQFLIGGTGTILNADLNQLPVQRLSGFNRLSLTYGGYIASGYAINDRMKLRLLVRYDADALDMMKHNNISQKMSGFGTDLSLQFKLKK